MMATIRVYPRVYGETGGHPRALDNFMLQKWAGKDGALAKDRLEPRLKRLVCAGKLDLPIAQHCIYDNWQACARRHPGR